MTRALIGLLRKNRLTAALFGLFCLCRHGRGGQGYLAEQGWFRSHRTLMSVDGDGRPLPWYSYPIIHWLHERVAPDLDVFEYGAGNSTLWWAAHARSVTACEHDRAWYEMIAARMPANATLLHRPQEPAEGYLAAVTEQGRSFDVVVIDGVHRVACVPGALQALSARGVIIWDNSNWYPDAVVALREQGFRDIEFYGLAPIAYTAVSTRIFYRDGNCLGL